MSANEEQIGGDHYQTPYQHWDFVTDASLGYLSGNATKYAARWRKKNGVEDLRKCRHYLVKLREVRKNPPPGAVIMNKEDLRLTAFARLAATDRFLGTLEHTDDIALIAYIAGGRYKRALRQVDSMISLATEQAPEQEK